MKSWDEVRNDFPILKQGIVYLDSASTSQKPMVVLDAISNLYTTYNANVHRGLYKFSEKTTFAYTQSKEIVASFLNAPSFKQIIYTKNASESLNMVAYMLEPFVTAGDEIIVSLMEHHSNLLPWQQLAKRKGLTIRYIPINEEKELDMDAFHALINEKTKIVALTHVSNVLGTVNPIKQIGAFLKDKGVFSVIDGAQAVGHIPVDVADLDIDFYAFSGHKVFAPTGSGVLYMKEKFFTLLDPIFYGGEMVSSVTIENFTYNENPWKFEAGTPNFEGGIALGSAISYIQTIGIDAVHERNNELTQYFLKRLQEIKDITIYSNVGGQASSVISFALKGVHPHDISQLLDKDAICIRAGMHCAQPLINSFGCSALARVSLHCYNNEKDLDRCITSLESIQKLFSHG